MECSCALIMKEVHARRIKNSSYFFIMNRVENKFIVFCREIDICIYCHRFTD